MNVCELQYIFYFVSVVLKKLNELNNFITHNASGYCCKYCNERSSRIATMSDHIQSAHNRAYYENFFIKIKTEDGVEFTCKDCDEKFTNNKLSYKIHSCKRNKNTKCDKCDKIIHGGRNDIRRHHRHDHGEVPYKCGFCDKRFTDMRFLREHENIHTRNKVFKCDICSKEFRYKQTLRRHISWHNGTNKKYMCEECGKSFNDVTNLNKHRDTVHLKLRRFACDQCPKTFTAKKHLKSHMYTHSGETFTCEICNKLFTNRYYLMAHKKIHDPNRKFVCQHCGKTFNRRGEYAKHLRVHAGDRVLPYKCSLCPKSFVTKYTHKRHMEYHFDLKKYLCDICNKKFSTRDVLRKHKNTVHDPNRDNVVKTKCEICKQNVTNFEKHMDQHVNRPLKCHLCPNTFNRKGSLNRHVKTRHINVSFVNCDVCGKKYRGEHCLKKHKLKVHKMSIKTENYDSIVPAFEIPTENGMSNVPVLNPVSSSC